MPKNKEIEFDPLEGIQEELDDIEKRTGISSGIESMSYPMSTGILMFDLLLGGGIKPAWYTHAGGEQSCKTTSALHVLMAGIVAKVPIIEFWDYEGSSSNSPDYVRQIAKRYHIKADHQKLFGVKDEKTGKWEIKPLVRYYEETIGEKFFDSLHSLEKRLPDKKYIAGKWWCIYENNKSNKSKYSEYADPSMSKKYGDGIYLPAKDGSLQALVLTDSYPAMNPSSNDEDEQDNSLALSARMFSKQLPRVKGRLKAKRIAVIGVNQIRAIPMARYGPTEQEPGGNALKFNSDVRLKHTSRALSGVPFGNPKGEGSEEFERSISGEGKDTYKYINVRAIKNKLSRTRGEVWIRLWVEDERGNARGFDPVFDTLYYLRVTGQLEGKNRKSYILNLYGFDKPKHGLSWHELKQWILGDKELMTSMSKKAGFKPMNLRKFCFKQVESGIGDKLYVKTKNSKKDKEQDEG